MARFLLRRFSFPRGSPRSPYYQRRLFADRSAGRQGTMPPWIFGWRLGAESMTCFVGLCVQARGLRPARAADID